MNEQIEQFVLYSEIIKEFSNSLLSSMHEIKHYKNYY